MSESATEWRPPSETPARPGWYWVRKPRDPDFGERARAFGDGLWWTPLPDGWLSQALTGDGPYEWLPDRLAPMEPSGSTMSPIEEKERAEAERDAPAGRKGK